MTITMTDDDLAFLDAWIADVEKAIPSLTAPAEQPVRARLTRQLDLLRLVRLAVRR